MKRIKFNQQHRAGGQTFHKGQTYEIPDDRRATLWVNSGIAAWVKPANATDAPARKAETAEPPAVKK